MGQYHGCWCPASFRCQDISTHDIDYVEWVSTCLTWEWISTTCVMPVWRNQRNCKYMFLFLLKNLACKELTKLITNRLISLSPITLYGLFIAEVDFLTVTYINSLRPSDAIWRQRTGSTLAQVMPCYLTAPSHYLNQCWLIISEVQWHSY